MTKKKNNDPSVLEQIVDLLIAFYSLFAWIIKGTFDALIDVYLFVAKIVSKITYKHRKKLENENIVLITDKTTPTNKYESLFSIQIRHRGEEYSGLGKVQNLNIDNDIYSCQVLGQKQYDVSITFDKSDNIKSASCTCPYYSKYNSYCKHIYALLYQEKIKDNKPVIYNNIMRTIKCSETMLKRHNIENSDEYRESINEIKSTIKPSDPKDVLLTVLDHINYLYTLIKNEIQKEKDHEKIVLAEYKKYTDTYQKNANAALKKLDANKENTTAKKKRLEQEEYEKDLDIYGLEEEEKELVRQGLYEPWQFKKEGELQEEDYYYDVDKDDLTV